MSIPTQPFEVFDFSGGITDHYTDARPSQYRQGDNFLIKKYGETGKLSSRPGSVIFNEDHPQITAGSQRIGALVNFDNNDELLIHSNRRIYFIDPVNGHEVIRGPSSNDVLTTGDLTSVLSVAQWNHHLLVTSDAFPSPMKIYRDENGDLQVRNAGLPKLDGSAITFTHAAGTESFIYAFTYEYTYQVGSVTFVDVSTSYEVLRSLCPDPSVSAISIGALPSIPAGFENYDTAKIKIGVYRTINGGTTLYKVGEVTNGTTSFSDNKSDDAIQANEVIYTTGGVLYNDPPPLAKVVHVVNDIAYYGNLLEGSARVSNRLRQSVRGDFDACPEEFYIDLDEEIVAISSVNETPIVLCRVGVFRIEGAFDELGRGGMSFQKISDAATCISSQSVVRTLDGIFWAGEDAFYFSDGFRVMKVSEELPETHKRIVSTAERKRRIVGTYDPEKRLVYWAVQKNATDCDTLYILHLSFGIRLHSTFTTASGGEAFRPTALTYFNGQLVRGDTRGYVLKHDDSILTDPEIDPVRPVKNWILNPVVYIYQSPAFNFGTAFVRKWVPKMGLIAKNLTNLSLEIVSNNDENRTIAALQPIRFRGNIDWGDPETVWRDESIIWGYDGLIEEIRRFPAGSLRCNYKQITLTNAKVAITNSDTIGTATPNPSLKTITLDSAASSDWPLECQGYFIAFDRDGYSKEYLILERADDTLTVLDPIGQLPSGSCGWVIRGIPKYEQLGLVGYTIHYGMITSSQLQFKGSTGENSK